MARVIEDKSKYESWTNTSHARHVIKRIGRDNKIENEMIGAMKTFHVTPEERRLNMEIAATKELDPFSNGQFIPVRLIETAEDLDEIQSNPNLIGESELDDLFDTKKTNWREFDKRVDSISNVVVLNRMMEMAVEKDATIRALEKVKARIEEVAPRKSVDVSANVASDRHATDRQNEFKEKKLHS